MGGAGSAASDAAAATRGTEEWRAQAKAEWRERVRGHSNAQDGGGGGGGGGQPRTHGSWPAEVHERFATWEDGTKAENAKYFVKGAAALNPRHCTRISQPTTPPPPPPTSMSKMSTTTARASSAAGFLFSSNRLSNPRVSTTSSLGLHPKTDVSNLYLSLIHI